MENKIQQNEEMDNDGQQNSVNTGFVNHFFSANSSGSYLSMCDKLNNSTEEVQRPKKSFINKILWWK